VCPPQRASSLGLINITPTLLLPGQKEFCSSDDLGIQPASQTILPSAPVADFAQKVALATAQHSQLRLLHHK